MGSFFHFQFQYISNAKVHFQPYRRNFKEFQKKKVTVWLDVSGTDKEKKKKKSTARGPPLNKKKKEKKKKLKLRPLPPKESN